MNNLGNYLDSINNNNFVIQIKNNYPLANYKINDNSYTQNDFSLLYIRHFDKDVISDKQISFKYLLKDKYNNIYSNNISLLIDGIDIKDHKYYEFEIGKCELLNKTYKYSANIGTNYCFGTNNKVENIKYVKNYELVELKKELPNIIGLNSNFFGINLFVTAPIGVLLFFITTYFILKRKKINI